MVTRILGISCGYAPKDTLNMLPRYRGAIVLREPAPPARPVSGLFPQKLYPQHRDIYGKLLRDHKVTIEQEIAEIRARHAAYREYNRNRWAARHDRQPRNINAAADHRALDESDA